MENQKEENKIEELMRLSGKCKATVYRLAKKFGRLPTVEELKSQKPTGRPRKYF